MYGDWGLASNGTETAVTYQLEDRYLYVNVRNQPTSHSFGAKKTIWACLEMSWILLAESSTLLGWPQWLPSYPAELVTAMLAEVPECYTHRLGFGGADMRWEVPYFCQRPRWYLYRLVHYKIFCYKHLQLVNTSECVWHADMLVTCLWHACDILMTCGKWSPSSQVTTCQRFQRAVLLCSARLGLHVSPLPTWPGSTTGHNCILHILHKTSLAA